MNNTTRGGITLGVVTALIIGIFFAVNSANTDNNETETDTVTQTSQVADETSMPTSLPNIDTAAQVGTYLPYSDENLAAADGNTLIFFSASWCPTCQALRRNLESNLADFPSDLTVLTADFDTSTDLRRTYGVTNQHTVIKVDDAGNEVARDVGQLFTLDEVIEFSES